MRRVFVAGLLALAVLAAACGTESADPSPDAAAGACLVGDPDCGDLGVVNNDEPLFIDDEPTDGAPPDDAVGMLVDGGLTVEEALATDASGVLAVQGFYVNDGSTVRLCDALAESFPPQCGGASIEVDGLDEEELDYQREAGVTWTNETTIVFCEIIDGAVVTSSNVNG